MAENFDLMEGLCRYSSHTHGEVAELLRQFPPNDRLSTPFELVQIGILEVDEARGNYAVAGFIKAFVDTSVSRTGQSTTPWLGTLICTKASLRRWA